MKKLAIITTHPIQYNAPLFKLLNDRQHLQLKVFYTWSQAKDLVFDPGFGVARAWDIPLLEGYEYCFVENTSTKPGSHHFNGIINPSIIKIIENYNADAILIYGWSFNSHLKVLRYFKGKLPIFFRGDSNLLDEDSDGLFQKKARRLFLKWVYTHIDKALYVGSANKVYYEKVGLKVHQLYFAPHAIDNNRFLDKEGSYERNALKWRQELGIRDTENVFLFAGKLEPKKNPTLLLAAFNTVGGQSNHLIIVGNGILEKTLKNAAADNRNVHFIDFQNQSMMPVVYRLANVFVLPSSGPGETWGLAVNEAMACGRPVLVSDKCGCAYNLVKENINGYVFKSNDKNDLIRKVNLLIDNNNKFSEFGKHSLQIIKEWSYDKICYQIENLLV